MLRIVWKGYDPFIQKFVMLWNAYGPLTAFHRPEYKQIRAILEITHPRFAWAWWTKDAGWIINAVIKYLRGGTLDAEEKELIKEIEAIYVPEYAEKIALQHGDEIRSGWRRIEPVFSEVTAKAYGEGRISGEVEVYFGVKLGDGAEGTPLHSEPKIIVLQVGTRKNPARSAIRVLPHEMIHILNKRSGMSKVLGSIENKTGLNAEEAFTSVITNLVLWKAGLEKEMFSRYYEPNWPELCELEDKIREIVREWWLNGGDLRKMIEGRLGR